MAKRTKVTTIGEDGKPTFLGKNKKKNKKAKPVKSEFRQWFAEQYGVMPGGGKFDSIHRLRTDVEKATYDLEMAKNRLAERELYEERLRAAHYAWIAREAILNEKGKGTCPENKPSNGT